MLMYHPLMYLEDSQVAQYKIYVLKHPETNEVFYVGQTQVDLQVRLSGHLGAAESNKIKYDYIQNILTTTGNKPIIEEVETIHGTCYIDKLAINEREIYWIKYYKSIGCKLLNSALMSQDARCIEYHCYLASIQRGETSWKYYYCGRTIKGLPVYDEKKLSNDGFRFPSITSQINDTDDNKGYDPFKNERFVRKIGYRRSYDDPLSYVPCYKDTDVAYYDDDY